MAPISGGSPRVLGPEVILAGLDSGAPFLRPWPRPGWPGIAAKRGHRPGVVAGRHASAVAKSTGMGGVCSDLAAANSTKLKIKNRPTKVRQFISK